MLQVSVFPISSALRDIEKYTAVFLIPHMGLFCPFMASFMALYDGLPTCRDRLYASFTRKPDLSAPSNNSSISSSDFPFVSGRTKAAMRK